MKLGSGSLCKKPPLNPLKAILKGAFKDRTEHNQRVPDVSNLKMHAN